MPAQDPVGFDDRVAIVTGAGGGLGKSHALLLAARGAKVVVNDIGGSVTGQGADVGPAEAVAKEICALGGEAVGDTHSVSTPDGGQAIVATALDNYGRVDIVVNNAGIMRNALFEETSSDLLDPVIDVHLRGAFNVTRPAWTTMRKQGYGRIVNTSSSSGLLGTIGQTNYGAAKSGILGLTRIMAMEGASVGIKVNAITPIAFTRMLDACLDGMPGDSTPDPEAVDAMRNLMGQFGAALVSPVVAFLAHESCPVTGEIFSAGGGQVSRVFVGRTNGFFKPDLSIEDVRDHLDEIRDDAAYTIPSDSGAETAMVLQLLGGSLG